MTIALIEIPHRRVATIHWFDDRDELIEHAIGNSIAADDEHPIDFDDAVSYLAHDWNGHLLIQSPDDFQEVLYYQGHQKLRVRTMIAALRRAFLHEEANADES